MPSSLEVAEQLSDVAELGMSAEIVIKALAPIMDRRLGLLLDKFQNCPPELGPILDIKAQIGEVWRIKRELQMAVGKGQSATVALQNIVSVLERKSNGNG